MMQLWKALWLCLYKEDNDDLQEEIAERIGKLIFRCPTLQEFLAANNLDENGSYISDEASEKQEKQVTEDSVTQSEDETHREMEAKMLRTQLQEQRDKEPAPQSEHASDIEEPEDIEDIEDFEEIEEFPEDLEEAMENESEKEEKTPEEDPLDALIDAQFECKGFCTLFFQCGLETFIREWGTVDMHRQGKFQRMIRHVLKYAMLFGVAKTQIETEDNILQGLVERLDQLIFNQQRINRLDTPQSLTMHVVDCWNDMLRFVANSCDKKAEEIVPRPVVPLIERKDTVYNWNQDKFVQQVLIETDAEFSADWLKQLLLPIINFYRTLDKEMLP